MIPSHSLNRTIFPNSVSKQRRRLALGGFVAVTAAILARPASAHVKWFSAYNVAAQPRLLEDVFSPAVWALTGFALAAMLIFCLLERTVLGESYQRDLNRMTAALRVRTDVMIRATCGGFFIAVATVGHILLTPELTTTSDAASLLQVAIAVGLIWHRTVPFSALGIVVLFGIAVHDYGVFHLMDYPIFLGVAAYLTLTALNRTVFGLRPIDIVRWAAGITLMWAGIEKWAYPEWTFPLFLSHPTMTMGFGAELYVRSAGVIEFTLAFALLWTPLVRRSAATFLAFIFISAIFEFGKIDAIGHSAIIIVLLAIIADDAKAKRHPLLVVPAYGFALAIVIGLYYGGHALIFGTALI